MYTCSAQGSADASEFTGVENWGSVEREMYRQPCERVVAGN
jgi:hypothetical protein